MQRTRCLMAPCSVLSKNLPLHHSSQRPLPWPHDRKGYGCSEDEEDELKASLVYEEALGHVHRKKGDECNEGKNLRYPVGKDAEDKENTAAKFGRNEKHRHKHGERKAQRAQKARCSLDSTRKLLPAVHGKDKTDYDAQNEGSNYRHAVTASAFKYVHISIEWVLIHCNRYSQPRSES